MMHPTTNDLVQTPFLLFTMAKTYFNAATSKLAIIENGG